MQRQSSHAGRGVEGLGHRDEKRAGRLEPLDELCKVGEGTGQPVKGDGDVAALLRREGLYSSQLSSWRRQRDEIAKVGMTSRKRGRKAKAEDPRVKELERENARLQRRLARVETMLEIQKKTSELLGIPLNPLESDEND